ncbi:J domain-containing protein [Paludisphaera mucosa]|uniref:J domain-containing protein n=1 Tax=Paludisphaera mucosa TaxID=3030827 RepID=A0ABT6FBA7_9BACT|nr:J domain-containing protein [Paludisphaera mucosa]MDG3004875.1 J domain-containing protein [Paludisphaera mucosa]
MLHHFPFDPRAVLGVSAEASPDEVRDAFREKSKKHHPDLGGDEWAFRMVVRAYEVLKSTADGGPQGAPAPTEPPPWMRPAASGFFNQGRFPFGGGGAAATATAEAPESASAPPEPPRADAPGIFQAVEIELIWIRFEMAETADAARRAPAEDGDGATLSVCMVVSWPRRSLVARTAEYANLGETLHHVIDAFNETRQGAALAVRSRIEDGQFVGWLSFPDVVAAQSGFLALRDGLKKHDLSVHLQTRDEIIPASWAG